MPYQIIGASGIRKSIRLTVSSDGRLLTGSLQLPSGQVLQRTFDLVPIRNAVLAQMRAMHEQMHGPMPRQEVSGFFSSLFKKATDVAKKIASSSAVKSLTSAVKEYGPDALAALPFGDKAMSIAKKLHDRIVEARNGSEDAIQKIRTLSEMAKAGSPGAQQAMEMAKSIGATLNSKAAMEKLAPKATGLLMAAKKGSDEAFGKIDELKALAESGDPKAADVMSLMSRLNDFLKSQGTKKEAVSGWAYNVPYRSPMNAVLEKTPGLGLMARSLYRDGLDGK